ncbi:hypothetical protein SH528x_003212 [Novipirellula sp. SH528]|uniref:hypothetical protein n=1 Tax=Novipirellula sp. SH528 TaxID=3454466 RepID=UPI003F9EFABC
MAIVYKTLAACALCLTAFSSPAVANTYQHIDHLALQIAMQSNQLVGETRHYQHTPEYRHLVSDARDMARLADHIHELAHHQGSVSHLNSDLAQLDAKFHHLESLFDGIEHRAARGYRHVHGNTSHVKLMLNSIENNIHHLREDIQSMQTPVISTPYTSNFGAYSSRWGGYNARPSSSGFGRVNTLHDDHGHSQRSRSRGITIGGGSSRFTIGF